MNPEISDLNLLEILGCPKKGIIFSDLDGVWFDESQNFAPPEAGLTASITWAQEAGFWVILNSDTAPVTLSNYATSLAANEWVIAENGGIIYIPRVGYWALSLYSSKIKEIRTQAIERLRQLDPLAYVWQGDATPFIQQKKTLSDAAAGQTAYLVNTSRITSVGIYTRKVSPDGQLVVDDGETQKTEQSLLSLLDKRNLSTVLRCKRYPEIGSCLIKDPSVNKADTVNRIVTQYGAALSYWMLGDTTNDIIPPPVRLGAVGNADFQLKSQAEIVAPQKIAEGADFIIRKILEKEGV